MATAQTGENIRNARPVVSEKKPEDRVKVFSQAAGGREVEVYMKRPTKGNLASLIRECDNVSEEDKKMFPDLAETKRYNLFKAALLDVGEKETIEVFAKEIGYAKTFEYVIQAFDISHSGGCWGDGVRAMLYYTGTEETLKAALELNKDWQNYNNRFLGSVFKHAVLYEILKEDLAKCPNNLKYIKENTDWEFDFPRLPSSKPLFESHIAWKRIVQVDGWNRNSEYYFLTWVDHNKERIAEKEKIVKEMVAQASGSEKTANKVLEAYRSYGW